MKKGISLVALLSTVVVLAVITSTVVVSGFDIMTNTNRREIITEILSLQRILLEKEVAGTLDEAIGSPVIINTTDVTESVARLVEVLDLEPYKKEVVGGTEKNTAVKELFALNTQYLGADTLKRGTGKKGPQDIYLYSKNTGKVYYQKGEKIGGDYVYTFTKSYEKEVPNVTTLDYYPKLKRLKFVKVTEGIEVAEDTEGYSPRYNAYVRVDSDYSIENITTSKNEPLKVSTTEINLGNTKLVRLNYTELTSIGSGVTFRVKVVRKSDGRRYEGEYTLKYLDEDAPNWIALNDSDMYYVKDEYESNVYIELKNSIKDSGSGVKVVKYMYGKRSIEEIRKDGIVVDASGKIQVERYNSPESDRFYMTIYAADYAGNERVEFIEIPISLLKKAGI